MKMTSKQTGQSIDLPTQEDWQFSYNEHTNETTIYFGNNILMTLTGEADEDTCAEIVAEGWFLEESELIISQTNNEINLFGNLTKEELGSAKDTPIAYSEAGLLNSTVANIKINVDGVDYLACIDCENQNEHTPEEDDCWLNIYITDLSSGCEIGDFHTVFGDRFDSVDECLKNITETNIKILQSIDNHTEAVADFNTKHVNSDIKITLK